jgi:hypothetical protein
VVSKDHPVRPFTSSLRFSCNPASKNGLFFSMRQARDADQEHQPGAAVDDDQDCRPPTDSLTRAEERPHKETHAATRDDSSGHRPMVSNNGTDDVSVAEANTGKSGCDKATYRADRDAHCPSCEVGVHATKADYISRASSSEANRQDNSQTCFATCRALRFRLTRSGGHFDFGSTSFLEWPWIALK